MSGNSRSEHNHPTTQELITPLQRKILMFLAVKKPLNINQTVKGMKGNYRSTWGAFKKLEQKELIREVKTNEIIEYPQYWLSKNGVLFALGEHVRPDILLTKVQQFYPKETDLQFQIEILPIFGESALKMLRFLFLRDGKVEQSELISLFVSSEKLTDEDLSRYFAILKRYPENYRRHMEYFQKVMGNVKSLTDLFEK